MHGKLTLSLSFFNKSLMISIFSLSIAKYNAVLFNYILIIFKYIIYNAIEIHNSEYHLILFNRME